MSSKPVIWINQSNLTQLPPKTVTKSLDAMKVWVKKADDVIDYVENILNVAIPFLSSPEDIVTAFIKGYAKATIKVMRDVLSFGGGVIVITPFNRKNQRLLEVVPAPYQLKIPSMTGFEAMQEFYASFDNTMDANRPQWTDNTKVTGLGFLILTPDPTALSQISAGMSLLFNFSEFNNVGDQYTQMMSTWIADVQRGGDDYATKFYDNAKKEFKFEIEGFPDLKYTYDAGQDVYQNGKKLVSELLVKDSSFKGELHWYGMNLNQFVFLKNTVDMIEQMIDKLTALTSGASSPIVEMVKALIRKIKNLKNLISTVYNAISGLVVSLSSSGLYYFSIPENTGGVNYIRKALQDSIANPQSADAKKMKASMESSKFSTLFFMGTSTGYNLDAWKAMFDDAWGATDEEANKIIGLIHPQFAISPNFENKVYRIGETIILYVASADSTVENPLFFDYSLSDSNQVVFSTWKNEGLNTKQWAKVNANRFPIVIPFPKRASNATVFSGNYTYQVNIYDSLGVQVGTKSGSFAVSNCIVISTPILTDPLLDTPPGTPANPGSGGIIITPTTPVTVTVTNPASPGGAEIIEEVFIDQGTTGTVGQNIPQGGPGLVLEITDDGGNTITIPITNNKGISMYTATSLPVPSLFKFLSFPAGITFDIPGYLAMRWKEKTSSIWDYYSLPTTVTVKANTEYEYWLFSSTTNIWEGPFFINVITRDVEGAVIC